MTSTSSKTKAVFLRKWLDFCKCDGKTMCLACRLNIIYREYQFNIYQHCLNLDFLAKVRKNLFDNLEKMLTLNNHFVCEIINEKFHYEHKDWFTGEKILLDLEKCLTAFEEHKIQKIMLNDLKIMIKDICK